MKLALGAEFFSKIEDFDKNCERRCFMEEQNINKSEENSEAKSDQSSYSDAPSNDQSQSQAPQAEANNQDSQGDADNNKAMAIIGYIIPILFFIPLVTDAKNNPFAKFHANQQLVLFLFIIAVNVVGSILPIIGWFLILPIGTIMIFVFAIMGIINASKGASKELPLIGGFKLIK